MADVTPNSKPVEKVLKFNNETGQIAQRKRVAFIAIDENTDLITSLETVHFIPKKSLSESMALHAPLDITAIFLFASFINWSDNQALASDIAKQVMTYGNAVMYKDQTGQISFTDLMPVFVNDGTANEVYYLDQQGIFHTKQGSFYIKDHKQVEVKGLMYDNLYLLSIDAHEPITKPIFNLLLQYDASLLANKNSLERFAESILVMTGNSSNQKLTDSEFRNLVNALVIDMQPQIDGNGELGTTPTADFIAPPINTEAREAWSNRLRFEILKGLMIIDFADIGGNPSSYTMSIYAYPTIKRAENIADQLLDQLKLLFNDNEFTFKVELPADQAQTMQALNNVDFISTERKIREAYPDWTDEQVQNELAKLDLENQEPNVLGTALNNVLGGLNGQGDNNPT